MTRTLVAVLVLAGGITTGAVVTSTMSATAPAGSPALPPPGPVSREYISQQPEAHLLYPRAALIRVFQHGEAHNPDAVGAAAGAVAQTPQSADMIYRWYQDTLARDGWKHHRLAALLDTWASAEGFQRGEREYFTVAVDKPARLSRVLSIPMPSGQVVFEYRYEITPDTPP